MPIGSRRFASRVRSYARTRRRTAFRTRRTHPTKSSSTSCSQNRKTRQPSISRRWSTSASRRRFRSSLGSQKSGLVLGLEPCKGQACQKQPSTKTATREPGNTTSGFPGSLYGVLNRNRKPARQRALRRASSGAVSRRLTRCIKRLRSSVVGTYNGVGSSYEECTGCIAGICRGCDPRVLTGSRGGQPA